MNSDQNETNKRPNEASEQENESADGSSPQKKFHGIGPNEHAKPKRRGRRGKKRNQRKSSEGGATCSGGDHDEKCDVEHEHPSDCGKPCLSWDSDEEDLEIEDFKDMGPLLRPTDVPKAPKNTSQFIIDDHDECRLYMSFETPIFMRNELYNSEIIEPEGEDAAYVDINYEYESPHDFDNSAYYDREFELDYHNYRYDELYRLSHDELIDGLRNLQKHLQELNEELVIEDPDPILERLQTTLLEEQEKHSALLEKNISLRQSLEDAGISYDDHLEEENANKSEDHLEITSEEQLENLDCISNTSKDADMEDLQLDDANDENDSGEIMYDISDPIFQCSEESTSKPNSQSPLSVYNQKESSESPYHIPCTDASNKENSCYDEVTFEDRLQSARCTPRHESCNDSCSEHIRKKFLRNSEYNETQRCEDIPLSSVSPEHELNAVAV